MVLYKLCEKEALLESNVLMPDKPGWIPSDVESHRVPQISPKACGQEVWVTVHHVTHPSTPEAPAALSGSPPAMTYLALPHHYLLPPRIPAKGAGQVSPEICRIKKKPSFSQSSVTQPKDRENAYGLPEGRRLDPPFLGSRAVQGGLLSLPAPLGEDLRSCFEELQEEPTSTPCVLTLSS